jgi:hypothetical protein
LRNTKLYPNTAESIQTYSENPRKESKRTWRRRHKETLGFLLMGQEIKSEQIYFLFIMTLQKIFFIYCSDVHVEALISKIFLLFVQIRRDTLNFMYHDVIGEYGNILLEFSPYALKYFLHVLRISEKILPECSETILCTANNPDFVVLFIYA